MMATATSRAFCNRAFSLCAVVSYLAVSHAIVSDADQRAQLHYELVISLGYGHLLGGIFFGWHRVLQRLTDTRKRIEACARERTIGAWLDKLSTGQRSALWMLTALALLGLLISGYYFLLARSTLLALSLLALSTWHSIENDLTLESTYASKLRSPPLSSTPEAHLSALGITSYLLALASASMQGPELSESRYTLALRALAALSGVLLLVRARGKAPEWTGLGLILASSIAPNWLRGSGLMDFSDLFAASTLYHLFSWGLLSFQRCRRADASPQMARHLVSIHAIPIFLLLATYAWPDASGRALRASFFDPVTYLFWSVLHVFQTAWLRTRPSRISTDPRPEP